MIATWMLRSVCMALLLACSGALLEPVLLRARRPTRALWGAVLLMALLLPAIGAATALGESRADRVVLSPQPIEASFDQRASNFLAAGEQIRREGAALRTTAAALTAELSVRSARWDRAIVVVWIVTSASLLVLLLVTVRRQSGDGSRSWVGDSPVASSSSPASSASTHHSSDAPVLLTEHTGPAAVGVLRPRILMPRWTLELDPASRSLVLRHEREHLAARDPLLLLSAAVGAALMPWNGPVWWMLRRLRLAIELDCDARVLNAEPDARRYASLLLVVSERMTQSVRTSPLSRVALVTLESSRSQLVRRLIAMTTPKSALLTRSTVVSACCALGFASLAVSMPAPLHVVPSDADLAVPSPAATPRAATPRAATPRAATHRASMQRADRSGTVTLTTPDGSAAEILVISRDSARLAVRGRALTIRTDTLRVKTPAALSVDLTSGGLRFVSTDSVVFDMRAAFGDGSVATSRGTGGVLTLEGSAISPLSTPRPRATIQVDSKSTRPVSVLVYFERLGGGKGSAKDTLRLTTPFRIGRSLEGAALHLRSSNAESIVVSAAMAFAPSLHTYATGPHIVLDGKGRGISSAP